jgi:RNA polymerase sigma-70 factor (ECF subfamily)
LPLEEQDATLWHTTQIGLAESLLREASRSGPTGRYQLEAAIQSAHTARRLTGRSNWSVVVQLYDHLLALTGSPVVVLNRAVALAEIDGPEAALAAIEPLNSDTRMIGYQPFWAAKGHLLARTGTHVDAAEAYRVAISSVVRVGVDAKRDGIGCEIGEHRVLAAAGTLAAWIPARRTARIDPIQALRYE